MLSLCGRQTPCYPCVLNKFVNKRDMAVCFIKSALHSGNKSDNTLNGGCGSQNILSWSNTARYLLYFTSCPLRDVLEILEEEYNKDSAGDGFGGSVDNVSGRQLLIDAEATEMQQPGIKVIIAVTAIVRSTWMMYS